MENCFFGEGFFGRPFSWIFFLVKACFEDRFLGHFFVQACFVDCFHGECFSVKGLF